MRCGVMNGGTHTPNINSPISERMVGAARRAGRQRGVGNGDEPPGPLRGLHVATTDRCLPRERRSLDLGQGSGPAVHLHCERAFTLCLLRKPEPPFVRSRSPGSR